MKNNPITQSCEIEKDSFKMNNFDLIRLFAASQVLSLHAVDHLKIGHTDSLWYGVLRLFPGVPIFFFISGFLISRSFENNSSLLEYVRNRALRIYPALIVCVMLSFLSVYLTSYLRSVDIQFSSISVWLVSQMSFVQFYNPEFMRGYGVGVLNGSLWTICVELQFYIIVPLMYKCLNFANKLGFEKNKVLILLIILFLGFNRLFFFYDSSQYWQSKHTTASQIYHEVEDRTESENWADSGDKYRVNIMMTKLVKVSFIPWFYMFLVGVYFQRNYERIKKYLSDRFVFMLTLYCLIAGVLVLFAGLSGGNNINPFVFMLLSLTIFSGAFSNIAIADRMLKKNDISYGIYMYHMPIINLFIYEGLYGKALYIPMIIILTCAMAILSWFVIERKFLRLKKRSLHVLS